MGKVEEDPPYLHMTPHYLPWHGHVTALSVAPQYRRLGLAQTLTGALERGCEEQKAWFLDLFVREGNETAIGLYKGLGYPLSIHNDSPDDDPLLIIMSVEKQIQRLPPRGRLLQRRPDGAKNGRRRL